MSFATRQRSAAAAKVFLTNEFCSRLEAVRSARVLEKSAGETGSTRPLYILFGCVRKPGTLALARLRRRANRLDNTPQMHRRLAFMLLASARALRPLARTLRGGNTLRTASAVTTMSDTHSAASSTSEGLRDRLGFDSERTQALRLPGHRRRQRRHRVREKSRDARCKSSGLREGCVRRHLRQRRLRPQKSHVQRGAHHGVRP